MNCPTVITLEQAEAPISSSVLPINGLRRDSEGNLSMDALNTIVDGLKSRGINPTDAAQQKVILKELASLLCSVNAQYQFLMAELIRRVNAEEPIPVAFLDTMKEKNVFMRDGILVARHIDMIRPAGSSNEFIEGWQNAGTQGKTTVADVPSAAKVIEGLTAEEEMLKTRSFSHLRKHMVGITQEKNKVVSNYLGMYGFLNLVAVGLLIYIAASPE